MLEKKTNANYIKNKYKRPRLQHFYLFSIYLVRFNGTVNTIRSFWCQGCVQTEVLSGNQKTKLCYSRQIVIDFDQKMELHTATKATITLTIFLTNKNFNHTIQDCPQQKSTGRVGCGEVSCHLQGSHGVRPTLLRTGCTNSYHQRALRKDWKWGGKGSGAGVGSGKGRRNDNWLVECGRSVKSKTVKTN